jgi:hypothetical protein
MLPGKALSMALGAGQSLPLIFNTDQGRQVYLKGMNREAGWGG